MGINTFRDWRRCDTRSARRIPNLSAGGRGRGDWRTLQLLMCLFCPDCMEKGGSRGGRDDTGGEKREGKREKNWKRNRKEMGDKGEKGSGRISREGKRVVAEGRKGKRVKN